MDAVRAPAAGLDLVRVQSPKLQFFFEQGTTYVSGVVEFARPATRKIALRAGMRLVKRFLSMNLKDRSSAQKNILFISKINSLT